MYYSILGIQYLSIILLFIEAVYVFSKKKTTLQGYLFLGCVATLVNNTGYLMEMQSTDAASYMVGLKISYLGRVWIPFSLFIFVLFVCKINFKKPVLLFLGGIHLTTFLLVLTTPKHGLYYSSIEYVNGELFDHLKCGHGPWYIAYSALLVFYIVFGIGNLLRILVREKNPIAKKRLQWITLAIVTESGFYLAEIMGVGGSAYDVTDLGYTIGTIFMYVAIFKYDMIDTMQQAKEFVIDEVSEAIVVVAMDGRIEYYNKPAKIIFEKYGNKKRHLIKAVRNAIENKEPIKVEDKIYNPEIKELHQNGMKTGEIIVLIDDTDYYKYLEDLKEQKDLAEAANASKSAFLSVVSHEIRTPMNAVVGMTELLLRDKENLSEKQEKYLKNIQSSGNSLVMIVNDILDQSKIEAGKMEIIEQPYEIRPMVEDVKLIIEDRVGEKDIRLDVEINENVPKFLVGDSLRLRQILINLMNNAVKFTDEGFIALKIKCVGDRPEQTKIRVSVEDSGQGILPEDLSKLGQAFSQVNTKMNHAKEGTGLGLSISKDFICLMGGQLQVSSVYGKGSEFYFEIWQGLAKEESDDKTEAVVKTAWKDDEDFTCKGAKILVVDDTVINLMIIEEILEPLKAKVETCESGDVAVELVKKNKYDMIFMDYFMPKMDGVKATEKIRFMSMQASDDGNDDLAKYFKEVPIITMTGDTSEDTRSKFIKAGINDFAEKPVDAKNIKKLLIKWLPEEKIKH